MFHRPGKKEKATFAKPIKDLTAIAQPHQLLLNDKRQGLLKKIEASCGLDASRFEGMCQSLIHHLIHHCQSLPETANRYFSLPGGLLDHALNRAEAALSLFRDYILRENGAELSEEQRLWIYAFFSASLLQGIGKLQIDYQVDLFDEHGHELKRWNPLLESMSAVASYYRFEFQPEGCVKFRHRLNLLLARLLMPVSGFNWIASNPKVLAIWLALLNEDMLGAGTLGAILIRADAIAIQRYVTEFMVIGQAGGRNTRPNRAATFVDNVPATSFEKEQSLGREFIQWLNKQLESGLLVINQALLMMVSGGLLVMPELFKLFIRDNPQYKNSQAIQKGLLSLNLHALGQDGGVTSRFKETQTQQMQNGILLTDYAVVLPETMKFQELNTDSVSSISAIELIHKIQLSLENNHPTEALTHLSANGQWRPVEGMHSLLKSGNKHSG